MTTIGMTLDRAPATAQPVRPGSTLMRALLACGILSSCFTSRPISWEGCDTRATASPHRQLAS